MPILNGELFWLTRHFKGYPTPLIVYDDNCDWHGYYDWNIGKVIQLSQEEYYNSGGIIVLGIFSPSTIAHEYRHHLQFLRHGKWTVPTGMENNWDLLLSYCKSCIWEHDAMMFERSLDECKGEDDSWFSLLDIPKSRQLSLELP